MCKKARARFTRTLALCLAATLVASPALARSRKHDHHAGRRHGHHRDHGEHRPHPGGGYAVREVHHHHEHGRSDVDGVFLALGIGAVGLTALALLAQAAPPPPPAYRVWSEPAVDPIDWNAIDDGVSVVSEGYGERGEFCREFQREIAVGGRRERGYGLACLQEDGSWRIRR
jgi:hypothetical protein